MTTPMSHLGMQTLWHPVNETPPRWSNDSAQQGGCSVFVRCSPLHAAQAEQQLLLDAVVRHRLHPHARCARLLLLLLG